MNDIGLGHTATHDGICVYIANRPPLPEYQQLNDLIPLVNGDISDIARLTGNHWRKIFNVYAKLIFSLLTSDQKLPSTIDTWQNYRDNTLLQPGSGTALFFSSANFHQKPNVLFSEGNELENVSIIMGKQYAASLGFNRETNKALVQIDADFAICPDKKLIVCPYFDYRQLSNIKIERLVKLIQQLRGL